MENKNKLEDEFEIRFYDPQAKTVYKFRADSVTFPNVEVVEFYDLEDRVWRAKSVRHLC